MKEETKEFLKQFLKLFVLVVIITAILGFTDHYRGWFNFKSNEYFKDILITLIGFLGVLVGFFVVGLSVFVSGLNSKYLSSENDREKIHIHDYWQYIINTTKLPI